MALETKTKLIGEYEYTVRQLDAVKGRRVFVRLTKVLAPMLTATGAKGNDEDKVSSALQRALANVEPEDVDFLCDSFAPHTSVKMGDKNPELGAMFGMHFAGKYDDLFKWLMFCVEVNFGSFLAKAGLADTQTAKA